MRIAMAFDGLGVGGIERVGATYAQILLDMGHAVDIYNLRSNLTASEESFPKSCTIFHRSLPDAFLPSMYISGVKRWWGKYVLPPIYLCSKAGLKLRKLVSEKTPAYDLAIAFSGHFRDLTYVSNGFINAEKRLCWLHGGLSEYLLLSYGFGQEYQKIRNLCAVSTEGQAYALECFPFKRQSLNINQIYNPIDLHWKMPDKKIVAELRDEFGEYLLMVGRFASDKDQKTIIEAYELLCARGIKNKLVFVGDGPTLESYEALVREKHLDDRVFFMGSSNNVQDYYASATLFVHSSPAEGMPTTFLEAMKYGCPIVATRSLPGAAIILGDDDSGLLCNVGDAQDMADKITLMLSDSKLRSDYIERGHKRVQDFSVEAVSKRLETILANLV